MYAVLYPFGPEREIRGESGSDPTLPKGDYLGLRIILGLTPKASHRSGWGQCKFSKSLSPLQPPLLPSTALVFLVREDLQKIVKSLGLTERAGDQAEGDKGCSPTPSMLKGNPPQQDAVAPPTLFSSHATGKKKKSRFCPFYFGYFQRHCAIY